MEVAGHLFVFGEQMGVLFDDQLYFFLQFSDVLALEFE
jgi:hypothetical protein